MAQTNRIKVVQCWDDGVVDDIRLTEVLRRQGAKASFNLNLGAHSEQRDGRRLAKGELRDVYDGFLVSNHGFTHPHLTRIPIGEAERCIREGRDALEQHFGYPVTGFAYPYGSYDATVMEAVREAGHVYARTVVATEHVFPPDNAMAFHPSCHFLFADFQERFQRAKETGDVFYFWGHSYEIVTEEDWQAFEAKIASISGDPAAEWTTLPELFPSSRT